MRLFLILVGLMLIGASGGCSTGYNTGTVAQEWGTAYNLAIANQTLNSDAEKNLKPVTGMENKAADTTIAKYEKEFEKEPQVPVYNLQLPATLGRSTTGGAHY